MKKKKTLLISIGALVVVMALVAVIGYQSVFGEAAMCEETQYLYLDGTEEEVQVWEKLEQVGVRHLLGFRILSARYHYGERIHSGRYSITKGESAVDIFRRLLNGHQTPINLVIAPVRTLDRLARNVGNQLMLDSAQVMTQLTDSLFCERMGFTTQTISCLFVPNTYEVYWNLSAEKFFERMQKEYNRFWTDERKAQAEEIGLTTQEVVTLASIVEEETHNVKEQPMVAGLYMNRLHKGMLLQADPTVKFAVGDFSLRRIMHGHLAVDSPYNTYKYKGLPPGPICIPSVGAVESVLHYVHHNYIYMCAKEDFSGTHNFAATIAEHQRNAARYRKALDNRGIK